MNTRDATEQAYKNGYTDGLTASKNKWISVEDRLPNETRWKEMKYLNFSVQVSNYATSELNKTLNHYGTLGFKLVNTIIAKNKFGCDVMYLFFTKENHPIEKGSEEE